MSDDPSAAVPPVDGELTARQMQFVREYLVDHNATQAAIRAGYAAASATVQGARLLANAKVAAALRLGQDALSRRTELTAERVMGQMGRLAFGDLRGAFHPDGRLKRPEEWDDDTAAFIGSIEVVTRSAGEGAVEHVAKIRSVDKRAATADLMRCLGMFRDSMEGRHPATVSLPPQGVAVQAAILRALEPCPDARAAVLAALDGIG